MSTRLLVLVTLGYALALTLSVVNDLYGDPANLQHLLSMGANHG